MPILHSGDCSALNKSYIYCLSKFKKMKKTILILMAGAMLASMTFLSSCGKDGATGPQGPQGNTGPAGSNASAAYELVFNVPSTSWGNSGTSGVPGAYTTVQLTSPYLSFDSAYNGTVNVFLTDGTINYALPYQDFNGGAQFNYQFDWFSGGVDIQVFNSSYTFSSFSGTSTYNVIVIPGAHKNLPNVNDYNALIAAYHPRRVK
jgi:hypothetical protein